jgi:hypothetical protein
MEFEPTPKSGSLVSGPPSRGSLTARKNMAIQTLEETERGRCGDEIFEEC